MPKKKSKNREKRRDIEFALPKSILREEGAELEETKKALLNKLKGRGKRGYGPILSQLILEEYIAGESTSSISKKYGIARSAVKDILYSGKRGSLIGSPPRSERGEHVSRAKKLNIERMSEEERKKYSKMMSDAAKALWEGMNDKEKEDFVKKKTKIINERIKLLTEEERERRFGTEWDKARLEYMSDLGKNWFKSLPLKKQEELKVIYAAMKNFQLKKGEAQILMEKFWEGMDSKLRKWKKTN